MLRLCGVNIVSPSIVSARLPASLAKTRAQCVCSDLLSLNPRDKELQEAIGIDFRTNFRIRRDFVETLDYVVISMQNITFDLAPAVGHGFSAGKLAAGFDIDMHERGFHQCGV